MLDGRCGPASCEELVHDVGVGGAHRPQFPAVDDLGGAGGGVLDEPGDLLDDEPRWLCRLTKAVRNSGDIQPSPIPASVQMRLNIFRTWLASSAAPRCISVAGRRTSFSAGLYCFKCFIRSDLRVPVSRYAAR
jgi:hypothetical protein